MEWKKGDNSSTEEPIIKEEYESVNHPDHYNQGGFETIYMMLRIWGLDKTIAFCEMNAFKYRMRLGYKPDQPIERDLEKARWYEKKAKALEQANK